MTASRDAVSHQARSASQRDDGEPRRSRDDLTAAAIEQLAPAATARMVASWEKMQERYATARPAQQAVLAEIIGHVVEDHTSANPRASRPVVLEIGCGPGSFTVQLSNRFPSLEIIGVDADPVLLALGRSSATGHARLLEAQVGQPGWQTSLSDLGPIVAVIGSAVLHYPPLDELRTIYQDLFALLVPGGLLINADQFHDAQPTVARLQRRAAAIAPPPATAPDWADWSAELRRTLATDDAGATAHPEPRLDGDNELSITDHETALRSAGFTQVGAVWRLGPSAVLVAVR